MKRYLATTIGVLLISINGFSQSVQQIPAELQENAYSVVLNSDIEFICETNKSGLHKETYIITILNEKGKDAGHFQVYCDKYNSLRRFSGEVFDGSGKSIRKLKKSDLKMSEYSSGLSTDDYMYYYECNASYPYTVKYEWEVKRKDGIISYPVFAPLKEFNQSVVESSYRLIAAPGIEPRVRVFNSDLKPRETKVANGTQYELKFANLKAVESEPYGPSITQLAPYAFFNPTDFFFDNTTGSMKSWTEYGKWAYNLLENRDVLPPVFKQRLVEMTAQCTTDREKVQVLYDFLANNTRYVSIQLGIGGFQPISAIDVNKTGFGDCKGLSNYLKAMLKAVGIDSNYTEIHMSRPRIMKDYVSLNQTNHIILQVPLENDTLWLECTNARIPFGYVHEDIAGHDAILITSEGGKFCTLPSYPDSLNTQTTHANVVIDATGKATINVQQESCLSQYEHVNYIQQIEPIRQRDFIRSGISLNQADISNLRITENKSSHPSVNLNYTINTNQYGNKTGNRLFIPANVFRGRFRNLPKKERKHDIYVKYGYLDTDSISINIPDGYEVESLAAPFNIQGKFGKFEAIYTQDNNAIHIVHRLHFRSGKYPKEEYALFNAFISLVSTQYGGKIVLRKGN